MNAKITRRVTVLCKLVYFLVLTGFSNIFTVRGPNYIDALIIRKKKKLRRIIMRRLTVFWKLLIFWAVIGFSENFTVKAPKCKYHGDHKITR